MQKTISHPQKSGNVKKRWGKVSLPMNISPLLGLVHGVLVMLFLKKRNRYLRTVIQWCEKLITFPFSRSIPGTETHLTQTQDYIEAIIYHRLRMTPMVIAKIFTDKKNVACWLHISMVLNDTCVPRF